jgi:hypothetical protein
VSVPSPAPDGQTREAASAPAEAGLTAAGETWCVRTEATAPGEPAAEERQQPISRAVTTAVAAVVTLAWVAAA